MLAATGVDVVGEVVLEGEMDDPVRRRGRRGQAVEVVEAAAVGGDALRREGGGRVVGAGEADDVVAVGEELVGDGRPDLAGGVGDEDAL